MFTFQEVTAYKTKRLILNKRISLLAIKNDQAGWTRVNYRIMHCNNALVCFF